MGSLRHSAWERKMSLKYLDYMALMSELIDKEPSSYQEVVEQQVW